MNKYESFLFYVCKDNNLVAEAMKKRKLYKHRVLPGHAGGTYEASNVVRLSYYFHAAAHYIRYLVFKEIGDFKAFSMMLGQTEEEKRRIASMAGKIGGKIRSKKMLESLQYFYDPEWQKKHGDRGGGRRNVESGFLARLNKHITENNPEFRSIIGKLGAAAQNKIMKETKRGFYSEKAYIQKLGNLKRWGIVIQGKRIPFSSLSSDFVDYYLIYGYKKNF